MAQQRLPALDGLRGLAAVAVLTLHLPDRTLAHLLPGSYLAVDLFFMLSGFVLAHAYGDQLRGLSLRGFMLMRYIRLAPMHILGAVLGLIVFGGSFAASGRDVAPMFQALANSTLFLPGPRIEPYNDLFPLNFPAWSLFFEMSGAILLGYLFLRARRLPLWPLIAGVFILLLGLAVRHGSLDGGVKIDDMALGAARAGFALLAGAALQRLHTRLTLRIPLPVLAITLLATFAAPVATSWRAAFDLLTVGALYPLLILAGAHAHAGRMERACTALGAASYPLYAIHVPLLAGGNLALAALGIAPSLATYGLAGSAVLMATLVALAIALDRYYDAPVRRWLTRPRPKAATA